MRTSAAVRGGAAVLLVAYSLVVARLTLLPASDETGPFGLLYRTAYRASGGRLDWPQIEVLANVALFVPFGLLAAVALRRMWAGLLLGVAASVAIELSQAAFLPTRVPSLADVEHNGMGALIGVLLAWPVLHALRQAARRRAVAAGMPHRQRVGV